MFGTHFYNEGLRKLTIAFGQLFNNIVIQNNENQIIKPKFVNSGFTLIYNEKLFTNRKSIEKLINCWF